MKNLFCLLFLAFSILRIFAQDHLISGFTSSPLSFNPAATGTFGNENLRVFAGFDKNLFPELFDDNGLSFSIDKSLWKGRLGLGINLLHEFGDDFDKNDYGMFSLSYHSGFLENKYTCSIGIQGGVARYSVDWDKLLFNDAGPSIYPADSVFISPEDQKYYPDYSLGTLVFSNSENSGFKPWFGLSVSHLFTPNISMLNISSPLPRKLLIHAGADIRLNSYFTATPMLMYSSQMDYRNLDLEGVMKYRSGKFLVSLGNLYEHTYFDYFTINQLRLLFSIGYAGIECRAELLLLEFNQLVDVNQSTGMVSLCWNLPKFK